MSGFNSEAYSDEFTVEYVAHQISGDIIGNMTKVLATCRQLHLEEDIIPSTPYVSFLLYLDDTVTDERMRGVYGDKALIARDAEGMQIFGPKLSFGVKEEAKFFKQLGRRITLRNPALENELDELLAGYQFNVKPFALKPQYLATVEKNLSGLVNTASWLAQVERFAELSENHPYDRKTTLRQS